MLAINLLPNEEKKAIARENTLRVIRFFSSLLMAAAILGSVFLLPSFLPSAFERRELSRSLEVAGRAAEAVESEEILSEIRGLRAKFAKLGAALERPMGAVPLFKILSNPEVSGIEISNLTVKETGEVSINGVAAARRDFLEYEAALKNSGIFAKIDFPLSNILPNADINFSVRGTLKAEFGL